MPRRADPGQPAGRNQLQAEKFRYLFEARSRVVLDDGARVTVSSYRDLAVLLSPNGLDESYVNRMVNGERRLTPAYIRRVCQIWRITEDHWAATSFEEFRRRFSPLSGIGGGGAWNTIVTGTGPASAAGALDLVPPAARLRQPPGAPPPPPLAPHVFAPRTPFHVTLVASDTRREGWPLYLFHYEHDRVCDCLIPTLYEEGSPYYATDRFPRAPARIALTLEPLVADDAPGLFGVLLAVLSPGLALPPEFNALFQRPAYRAASHDPRMERLAAWALEQHGLGMAALLGVTYEVRASDDGPAATPPDDPSGRR